jgi:glycogen phosphorylase
MSSYIGSDRRSIQRSIVNHVEYTLGLTRFNFDDFGAYQAASLSVKDRLIEAWNDTNEYFTVSDNLTYSTLECFMDS